MVVPDRGGVCRVSLHHVEHFHPVGVLYIQKHPLVPHSGSLEELQMRTTDRAGSVPPEHLVVVVVVDCLFCFGVMRFMLIVLSCVVISALSNKIK